MADEQRRRPGRPPAEDRDGVKNETIYIRCEPDLVRALDEEAAAMSQAAGGANIKRSEAARVCLRRALAHRLSSSQPSAPTANVATSARKTSKPSQRTKARR